MIELTASNAQLCKALAEACAHETELSVEAASLRADFSTTQIRETTLQTSLDEARRVGDERLAQLETVAGDAVLFARAELIQEFKDEGAGSGIPIIGSVLPTEKRMLQRRPRPLRRP